MNKNKLSKKIESFITFAGIVAPLCSKYNLNSIKPFLESAQIYNENFRSNTEFNNLLRLHQLFCSGSINICNRLFDNYEESKQSLIYDWSKHIFNLLDASKKIIDEAYNLAYTVGRDDTTTKSIVDKEKNPLVKIYRKVILEDGEYEAYKKSMFDWKCNIQSLYVEEQYMKHVVELCNSRNTNSNATEAKIQTCSRRKTIYVSNQNYESTPKICVLNAELYSHKSKIDNMEKENNLSVQDIDNYVIIYKHYQHELLSFVLHNFIKLYNETCVQCLKVFLEQQHGIVFSMLQKRKKILSTEVMTQIKSKQIDGLTWNDIDKATITNRNCSGVNQGTCTNQTKFVGSLK